MKTKDDLISSCIAEIRDEQLTNFKMSVRAHLVHIASLQHQRKKLEAKIVQVKKTLADLTLEEFTVEHL